MHELKTLETSALVDLLAETMSEYYELTKGANNDDRFRNCSLKVRALQAEIESRKKVWYKAEQRQADRS